MKIIDWNVNFANKRLEESIYHIFNNAPDIVCLQEFPRSSLNYLKNFPYKYHYTYDWNTISEEHTPGLLVTAVRENINITNSRIFTYANALPNSIMNKLYYELKNKTQEHNNAIIVELENKIQILNIRLSVAAGPSSRIDMLKKIFEEAINKHTIICGDLNTFNSKFLNLLTGVIRGFKFGEFLTDEYRIINDQISKFGFINKFLNQKTLTAKIWPRMQFDYVLVPNSLRIRQHGFNNINSGSDHRILEVIIDQ